MTHDGNDAFGGKLNKTIYLCRSYSRWIRPDNNKRRSRRLQYRFRCSDTDCLHKIVFLADEAR